MDIGTASDGRIKNIQMNWNQTYVKNWQAKNDLDVENKFVAVVVK